MKGSSICRLVLVLTLAATSFIACSRDPSVRKRKYLESGQRYFDKGKYREASIQFGNAVQVDPRFAQGHYRLAQSFLKLQQWTRAYQEFSRTVELEPKIYQSRTHFPNPLLARHA